MRLNEFLSNIQIIGLSATINNPDFFNVWLSSLGEGSILIHSDIRPVPLHYNVRVSQNKDSTIKKIVNKILQERGQILIFLNKRKDTQRLALNLKSAVQKHLTNIEAEKCK